MYSPFGIIRVETGWFCGSAPAELFVTSAMHPLRGIRDIAGESATGFLLITRPFAAEFSGLLNCPGKSYLADSSPVKR